MKTNDSPIAFIRKTLLLLGLTVGQLCGAATLDITSYGATPNDSSNDDSAAINAAIGAAQPGDTIFVPAGKYHIANRINLKSDMTLKGVSYQQSEIAALFNGTNTRIVYGSGVANVRIENLRIKSNSASEGVDRLVHIVNSSNVSVHASSFYRFNRAAVYFNSTRNGQVYGSRFADATAIGGGGEGYGVMFTNGCDTGRVEGSKFLGPNIRHGVVIQGNKEPFNPSHGIEVIGNYFKDNSKDSIDLHGYGEYDNYIAGNEIDADPSDPNAGRGIGVGEKAHGASGPGNVIEYNRISNTWYGVHVDVGTTDVTVQFNTVSTCKRHGIYLERGSRITLLDNTVTGCQKWGVYLQDADDVIMRRSSTSSAGNVISGNGLSGVSYGGVRMDPDSTGFNIQGNDFCGNDAHGGVNLSNAGSGIVKKNACQ